jgi:hypothetical protein
MTISIGAGITLGSGIDFTPAPISFTLTTSSFTSYARSTLNISGLGVDGIDGFSVAVAQDPKTLYYAGLNLTDTAVIDALIAAGATAPGVAGKIWNVTWADSSIGLAKVGLFYNSEWQVYMVSVNPSVSGWETGCSGLSLIGTFPFPATFTLYSPETPLCEWYI